ncbi:SDR family oxidoreductase [Ammonicoccus fulvus]|uniref:SDR family oxidoreductase n=1 Tax=Ammonicoccus fulvus TaxID=3138240 RepID=A0ABZ3FUK8_9ACTN
MQFQDKVFVVTGGANGMGREVVLELLARGARVAAVDLQSDPLGDVKDRVRHLGDRLTIHPLDITDRAAVEALPAAVIAAHGQVDGLLNVAGIIQPFDRFAELDRSVMERVMNVNFWGVINTCQAFLPALLERPEACIVNVSSMGALAPVPGQTIYGASKAALKLFTEGLYAELRDTNVDVTIVFPGAVQTEITANSGVEMRRTGTSSKGTPKMLKAKDAALQILAATEKGAYRATVGSDATMLDRLSRLAPQRATDLIADKMKALLAPSAEQRSESTESAVTVDPSPAEEPTQEQPHEPRHAA